MSLRKSPTRTPAFLAANRRNAKKSTGPKSPLGKAWSRWNRLRTGMRSPQYLRFIKAMQQAPPGEVGLAARDELLKIPILHPVYHRALELWTRVERELIAEYRQRAARYRRFKRKYRQ
jgi:hypothetical protein